MVFRHGLLAITELRLDDAGFVDRMPSVRDGM